MGAFIFAFGALAFMALIFGCVLWVGSCLYSKFHKDPAPIYKEMEQAMLRMIEIEKNREKE